MPPCIENPRFLSIATSGPIECGSIGKLPDPIESRQGVFYKLGKERKLAPKLGLTLRENPIGFHVTEEFSVSRDRLELGYESDRPILRTRTGLVSSGLATG